MQPKALLRRLGGVMKKGRWIIVLAMLLCVVCTFVFLPGSLTENSEDTPDLSSAQVQPLQAAESVLAPIADQEPRAAVPAEPPNEVTISNATSLKPETKQDGDSASNDTAENKAPDAVSKPLEEPCAAAKQSEESAVVSAPENDTAPKTSDEDVTSAIIPELEDHKTNEVHTHNFVLTATKSATCVEDGLNVYTCKYGESYEESISALGHQWELASTFEVIDSESYCKFKYAVMTCTSPECIKDGRYVTAFSAKDYGYSYERLYAAYSEHASLHLANGKQASYTTQTAWCSEPAALYDQLLSEQNSKPHAVLSLQLIPAVTHIENIYRCSRCGAEQ